MWQRFNEEARGAITTGRDEAIKAGRGQVGTEYLLLGLTIDENSLAAVVLREMGVDSYRVRQEIAAEFDSVQDTAGTELQFSPAASYVLNIAAAEARHMEQNYIGTEHLLLALSRYKEGQASRILSRLGLENATLRLKLLEYSERSLH